MMLLGLLLVAKFSVFTFVCFPDFNYSDPDSVLYPQSEFSSLTSSAVSSGEQNVAPADEETTKTKEEADDNKAISVPQQKSEATHDSMSVKGQTSQVKQTLSPGATGNVDWC